jgi:hypothetical protein
MRERALMAKRALEEIEATIDSISIDYAKDRVTSSPVSPDRIGDLIDKLSALRREYIEQAHEFVDVANEVRRLINGVSDPRFHELLCRRYLFNQRWERIAVDMGYDFRYILKLHARALEQVHRQITGGHKG